MEKFYNILKSITLKEVVTITGDSIDEKYNEVVVTNMGTLEVFNENSIIYFAAGKVSKQLDKFYEYKEKLKTVKVKACFINKENLELLPENIIPIISEDPKLSFIKLSHKFYEDKSLIKTGISKFATIKEDVVFKDKNSVHIGDFAVIESGVEIGANCYIASGVKIKAGVKIGDNCVIKENAVINHSQIGNFVSIGENSTIGGSSFGWHPSKTGHVSVPQLGSVILQDFVDIGANTLIDRGALDNTVIGEGSKIGNACQIAHNVKIGKHCIFAGKNGIAGSTTVGDFVLTGAGAEISGHLKIGDFVQIGAGSGVLQNIDANTKVAGYPAIKLHDFLKQSVMLKKMLNSKK